MYGVHVCCYSTIYRGISKNTLSNLCGWFGQLWVVRSVVDIRCLWKVIMVCPAQGTVKDASNEGVSIYSMLSDLVHLLRLFP